MIDTACWLSILVPAYRVESYIGECLDSVLTQAGAGVEVVVIDDGRIAADGTHDELMHTSDVYREIHDHGLVDRRFVDADGDHVIIPVEHEEASA